MENIKRILLVEDDLDDQFFFCEALNEFHPEINCRIAMNGAEALELVGSLPPFDVIFLDLNMPKIDGFECLQRLKADPTHKAVPVVVISTSRRKEDMQRSEKLGATLYVSKPPPFEKLFRQLLH